MERHRISPKKADLPRDDLTGLTGQLFDGARFKQAHNLLPVGKREQADGRNTELRLRVFPGILAGWCLFFQRAGAERSPVARVLDQSTGAELLERFDGC